MQDNRWSSVTALRVGCALAVLAVLTAACKGRGASRADRDDDDDEQHAAAPVAAAAATGVTQPATEVIARGRVIWTFDSSAAGAAPHGFSFGRTGSGRVGQWVVRSAPDAPSAPNVLAQEDSDRTDYRFPVAVADSLLFGDVSVSVRCKPVSGHVDQACGIVWRYQDQNNYYLARANALEDNVRLYYVKDGRRIQTAGWNGKVRSGAWHELRVDMRVDRIEVSFDGKQVIQARDSKFTAPGKVGVWTKADSHTLFDDLTAAPLEP